MKVLIIILCAFFSRIYAQDTLFLRGAKPLIAQVIDVGDDYVIIQNPSTINKLPEEKIKKADVKAIRFNNGFFEKYAADAKYIYVETIQLINSKTIQCIVMERGEDTVIIDTENSYYFISIPNDSIANITDSTGKQITFNLIPDSAKFWKVMQILKNLDNEIANARGDPERIKELFDLFVKDEKYKDSINDLSKREIILEYCHVLKESYFTGSTINDLPNGKGVLFKPDGEIQTGEFVDGKLRGRGIIVKKDSTVKQGLFLNGELNDEGIITNLQFTMKGKFKDDQLYGRGGMITLKDGSYEFGQYDKSRLMGVGERHFLDSNFYKGDFNDGKFQGQGIYTWLNQNITYEGGFKEGKMNGLGILKIPEGITISGVWKNNCPDGDINVKKQAEKANEYYTATWVIKDCKVEAKKGNSKKIKFDDNLLFIKMTSY